MSETCTSNDCANCTANCGERKAPQDLRAPANPLSRVKKVIDYDQIADPFGMVYFKVNLGKADGYGKVSLADFIIRNARIHDTSIGKIQLGDEESLVQVHRDFANRMTMDLTKAKHKGKHVRVEVVQE